MVGKRGFISRGFIFITHCLSLALIKANSKINEPWLVCATGNRATVTEAVTGYRVLCGFFYFLAFYFLTSELYVLC